MCSDRRLLWGTLDLAWVWPYGSKPGDSGGMGADLYFQQSMAVLKTWLNLNS